MAHCARPQPKTLASLQGQLLSLLDSCYQQEQHQQQQQQQQYNDLYNFEVHNWCRLPSLMRSVAAIILDAIPFPFLPFLDPRQFMLLLLLLLVLPLNAHIWRAVKRGVTINKVASQQPQRVWWSWDPHGVTLSPIYIAQALEWKIEEIRITIDRHRSRVVWVDARYECISITETLKYFL